MPKRVRRRSPSQNADLEHPAKHEPLAAGQSPTFTVPVSIRVDHYRCRLADTDGPSTKAAIDGLVHCGILLDDSTKEITEIRHFQHKVKNSDEEKTVFTIRPTEASDETP